MMRKDVSRIETSRTSVLCVKENLAYSLAKKIDMILPKDCIYFWAKSHTFSSKIDICDFSFSNGGFYKLALPECGGDL